MGWNSALGSAFQLLAPFACAALLPPFPSLASPALAAALLHRRFDRWIHSLHFDLPALRGPFVFDLVFSGLSVRSSYRMLSDWRAYRYFSLPKLVSLLLYLVEMGSVAILSRAICRQGVLFGFRCRWPSWLFQGKRHSR